ncbi:MAG: UbiX family flavin prenyltransferase [Anaerolineales bacterium]
MKRILLAISGASGAILGVRTLELLRAAQAETHLIVSPAARRTLAVETGCSPEQVEALATFCYAYDDIGARPASGSFAADGMLVVPCSIKTLSAIAHSYADNLIVRAADVCLKEGRPLLLAVRETPLHRGHLRLMDLAARAGAVIFPPIPAFYGGPQTLDDLVTALAGRMLLRLGIETDAYPRWGGEASADAER